MIKRGFKSSQICSDVQFESSVWNYLVIITKKPDFLDIEILGVLNLEDSIAWETKRFFGS